MQKSNFSLGFRYKKINRILITGGLGFIGNSLIRYLLTNTTIQIFNFDKKTYASDEKSINLFFKNNENKESRYFLIEDDLANSESVENAIKISDPDIIIHLAAESHVDNSIKSPEAFINTNIIGTYNILQYSLAHYEKLPQERKENFLFHHISTDEVYGSLDTVGLFSEDTKYDPRSPYSATKAASDHLVNAWHHTYKLPTLITNCCNNYGPWQFPEKLIPITIINAATNKKIPVYGDGSNVRDWIYVADHIEALFIACTSAKAGESYCIGSKVEKSNLELVSLICKFMDDLKPSGKPHSRLINFVNDRPGHDKRYGIDPSKIMNNFKWKPKYKFDESLYSTVKWYLSNLDWCENLKNRNLT